MTALEHGHQTARQRASSDPSTAQLLRPVTVTDAVARGVLDAAPDGLLTVDERGAILLSSTRVEELFGYNRGELLGQLVEVLMPDGARMSHGMQLVGRHRDGREFPVEIGLSPFPTEDGQWAVVVIRDETGRRERAVVEEDIRIASDLVDTVIRGLFGTGLHLHSVIPKANEPVRTELIAMVGDIDKVIREIRDVIFALTPALPATPGRTDSAD